VNADSATIDGSGVLVFTALAVLDVDGDELLDSARAEVLVGTDVDADVKVLVPRAVLGNAVLPPLRAQCSPMPFLPLLRAKVC